MNTTTKPSAVESLAERLLASRRRRQEQEAARPGVGAADRERGRPAGRAWALLLAGDEGQLRAAAGILDGGMLHWNHEPAAAVARAVGVRWSDVDVPSKSAAPPFWWIIGFLEGVAGVYKEVQAHLSNRAE